MFFLLFHLVIYWAIPLFVFLFMRDLKKNYKHCLLASFRDTPIFSRKYRFTYAKGAERISYYNGQAFRSLLVKPAMAGYSIWHFARNKVTGTAIHNRKKKKKKGKK